MLNIEYHPLEPFLPSNAKLLMLGSFPPKRERWSMDFYYPNFQNDMWRIMGYIFFDDKSYFINGSQRAFCRDRIINFCNERGLALSDSARSVRRLKDNASDKFLEVVDHADIDAMLAQLPDCKAIVVTGQKAAEVVANRFGCVEPSVGRFVEINASNRKLKLYRMPSSSRAYPMSVENKAAVYREMFSELGYLLHNIL